MIQLIMILSLSNNLVKAPSFTAYNIKGEKFYLDSLNLQHKDLIIVDFWALFCRPCIKQMEKANKFIDKYGEKVTYIAINEDGPMSQKRVRIFIKAKKFKFPVLLDLDGKIGREYGVTSLPTTFILDDSLRILKVHYGFKTGDKKWFENTIEKYLNNKGK